MDPVYLQGLRDAKALVDEGVFSKEDFDCEKQKLTAERDARAHAVAMVSPAKSSTFLASGDAPTYLLTGGSSAMRVMLTAPVSLPPKPAPRLEPSPMQSPAPTPSILAPTVVHTAQAAPAAATASAPPAAPLVDRSGKVPSAAEIIASLSTINLSGSTTTTVGSPDEAAKEAEVPDGAFRALTPKHYTIEEIRQFDGGNPGVPIFILCRGNIFDVSSREDLYGITGPYSYMTGRDSSRILAKMARKGQETDSVAVDDLNETELKTLGQWEDKFKKQYPIVGYLKGATKPVCQIDVW